MTMTFAPARPAALSPAALFMARRSLGAPIALRAANDNSVSRDNSELIHAALKHFARHGVSAAARAAQNARAAAQSDDPAGCRHWLDICSALDRRLGAATERQVRLPQEKW